MHKKILGIIDFKQQYTLPLDLKISFSQQYHDSKVSLFDKTTSTANISIQFQGSLYNKKTLASTLSLPQETEDTSLLIAAYQKWGTALLKELDGIFSFALIDSDKALLFLAKDRVSVHPIFYYHDENSFLFSSSLNQLSHFKHFQKSINPASLANYFTYGYIMQPNTIYKDCYKLKSGHFLLFDLSNKTLKEEKYWDLGDSYSSPKLDIGEEEFKIEAKKLLQNSIKKRLVGVDSFGASLSGGYDSSTIVALLQEQSNKNIDTFTIGFEDESINEAPDAKKIATHLGTQHHEHYFLAKDALHIIPKLATVYDEPFYDNGSIPTTLLASLIKDEEIGTIFAGDGGDEVFATADDIERFDRILSVPQTLRSSVYHALNILNPSHIPYINEKQNFPTRYYKFINFLKAASIPEMVKVKMTLFHPYEIKQLINDQEIEFPTVFDDIYFGEHAQSVDKVIGSYFKTFLTDGELIKTTQAFAYENIAIREPYLDYALIDFMARVPSDIKIKNGIKKNILKQIAYDYIPKNLLDRPKKGFSIPFSRWMKHELKPLLMETLSEENLNKDGILETKYVINIRNNFLKGKEEYKYKLWSILLYQLWYEKHMR